MYLSKTLDLISSQLLGHHPNLKTITIIKSLLEAVAREIQVSVQYVQTPIISNTTTATATTTAIEEVEINETLKTVAETLSNSDFLQTNQLTLTSDKDKG